MKSLFPLMAIVAALVVLDLGLISAESFTEGVRVSPETVTLKPGQYVWEPERAPEGPLLIVASITEQVAYVYRNGIRIARSSAAVQKSGLPAAFLDKAKAVITPGATLIFTDRSVDPSTQSPPNFQILVAQKNKPART